MLWLFLQFSYRIEDWRIELDLAIAHGLYDFDEEKEDMVVEWLFCRGDGSELDEEKKNRLGSSTLGRRFVHQDCKGGT